MVGLERHFFFGVVYFSSLWAVFFLSSPLLAESEVTLSKNNSVDVIEESTNAKVSVVPNCPPEKKGTIVRSQRKIAQAAGEEIQTKQCVSPNHQYKDSGISFGDFSLENNAWGGHRSTWKWEQCTEVRRHQDGSYLPGWSYDWGDEDSYQSGFYEWVEKSFPRIVSGVSIRQNSRSKAFMTEEYFERQCKQSGLPSLMKDIPQFKIDFSYSSSKTKRRKGDVQVKGESVDIFGGERNAVFASLFYPSCSEVVKPLPERSLLLLVWTEKGPERLPSGKPPIVETFTDSMGREFEIFTKVQYGDDSYLAFVPKTDFQSGTIIWNDFLDFTKSKKFKDLGLIEYSEDWCMVSIMFGTEIWWGEGFFQLDKFQITRTY